MKEYKHFGSYGLITKGEKILLIRKKGGPYDGCLDLPGGTIKFGERPSDTLKRELMEEVGINIKDYFLFDADSVKFTWNFKNNLINVHHIGIFYRIKHYENEVKKNVEITKTNDDSLGADFYEIKRLTKEKISAIALMELEHLGYTIK